MNRRILLGPRSLTIDVYLIKLFFATFFIALLFFVLILQIADLFMNIVKFLQNEVPFVAILKSMLLYVPKCISYSLPISVLFSASFTLGTFYANNELIIVYASGISLSSFMLPMVVLCAFFSVFTLFFEDMVVLPTSLEKKEYTRSLTKIKSGAINLSDVTILGEGKRFIWNIGLYDDAQKKISNVVIIERDIDGKFVSKINAQSGTWTGSYWRLQSVRRFFWQSGSLTEATHSAWDDENLREPPESFKGGGKPPAEMNLSESREHLRILRRSGMPGNVVAAEYYKRFAFALTPIIVVAIAGLLAGRFKKNILLMSLLYSLIAATLYFVVQMISMILAKNDIIPPFMGGFSPVFVFLILIGIGIRLKRI